LTFAILERYWELEKTGQQNKEKIPGINFKKKYSPTWIKIMLRVFTNISAQ
jgi:hypothetical protein